MLIDITVLIGHIIVYDYLKYMYVVLPYLYIIISKGTGVRLKTFTVLIHYS